MIRTSTFISPENNHRLAAHFNAGVVNDNKAVFNLLQVNSPFQRRYERMSVEIGSNAFFCGRRIEPSLSAVTYYYSVFTSSLANENR